MDLDLWEVYLCWSLLPYYLLLDLYQFTSTSLILYQCWRLRLHVCLPRILQSQIVFFFSLEDFHNLLVWCCKELFLSSCCNREIPGLNLRYPCWLLSPLFSHLPFFILSPSLVIDDRLGIFIMKASKYLLKELPVWHIVGIIAREVINYVRI